LVQKAAANVAGVVSLGATIAVNPEWRRLFEILQLGHGKISTHKYVPWTKAGDGRAMDESRGWSCHGRKQGMVIPVSFVAKL
jgi:hypothetical protein